MPPYNVIQVEMLQWFYYLLVLAFAGAPASFPVQLENRDLQRYLKWNKEMSQAANSFIKTKLPKGGFIGIHLRNGIDWVGQYLKAQSKEDTEIQGNV